MNDIQWNPGTLLETSGYYWKTCTLHTGVKLDIFTVIVCSSLDYQYAGIKERSCPHIRLIRRPIHLYSY